jgi:uncharacterized protein YfbU (UPF0304 family)
MSDLIEDESPFALDEALSKRVDAWRASQDAPLTRNQAIAELVKAGLRGQVGASLSMGEKLILSVLCGVSRKVDAEGMIDPDFLEDAIKGGHSWAIEWEHPTLSHGHTNTQNTANFVISVLSMWRLIEDSFSALADGDKALVRQQAGLPGDPVFPGWDSELEANYKSTARFMTDRMNLFPMFEGRSASDSGEPVVARYKQMLAVLEDLGKSAGGEALDARELVSLLRTS